MNVNNCAVVNKINAKYDLATIVGMRQGEARGDKGRERGKGASQGAP